MYPVKNLLSNPIASSDSSKISWYFFPTVTLPQHLWVWSVNKMDLLYQKYCELKIAKSFLSIFWTPLQHFTSLSFPAKFEFGFDSFGEDYGIKTFLNKCLSTRLDGNVKFQTVVIWFEYTKVSNYDLPKYNTTKPSCIFQFFYLKTFMYIF